MLVFKEYVYLMLRMGLDFYMFLVFIYILAGWFVRNRYAGWYVFLTELCEPPLRAVRRLTQGRLVVGNLDLSPILLYVFVMLLQRLLYVLYQTI